MRIIKILNRRRIPGGEDYVFDKVAKLLKQKDEYVYLWIRSNSELGSGLLGKMKAFIMGIYSPAAGREMNRIIDLECPDVVHAHNILPMFSPSVLVACRRKRVPVVLHCHSYLLTCPTTFHFKDGKICERCLGGREYWCVIKNCRNNIFESIGYALRNIIARKMRFFSNNVTLFVALNEFARGRLVNSGFREDRVVVLPNMVYIPAAGIDAGNGEYVGYSGRLSHEKGVDTLLGAARKFPFLSVRIAGDGPLYSELKRGSPENVSFVGWLDAGQLNEFYRKARFVVVPSKWFEVCPIVILEAMANGLPVIASKIGGLPEIVENGVTGFLFEPGNAKDLADKMKLLWEDINLCRRMGEAARERAMREYRDEVYYKRLTNIYKKAISIGKKDL